MLLRGQPQPMRRRASIRDETSKIETAGTLSPQASRFFRGVLYALVVKIGYQRAFVGEHFLLSRAAARI